MKFNYEIKEKIVRKGDSKIFENWAMLCGRNDYTLTEKEFLENLKWVCEDPLDEIGRLTREIGLTPKGLIKLNRIHSKGLCFFVDQSGCTWSGESFKVPCDNPDYADADSTCKQVFKLSLSAKDRI